MGHKCCNRVNHELQSSRMEYTTPECSVCTGKHLRSWNIERIVPLDKLILTKDLFLFLDSLNMQKYVFKTINVKNEYNPHWRWQNLMLISIGEKIIGRDGNNKVVTLFPRFVASQYQRLDCVRCFVRLLLVSGPNLGWNVAFVPRTEMKPATAVIERFPVTGREVPVLEADSEQCFFTCKVTNCFIRTQLQSPGTSKSPKWLSSNVKWWEIAGKIRDSFVHDFVYNWSWFYLR